MSINRINLIVILLTIINHSVKCINSIPDLSQTSNKFNSFTIDFRGIDTPPGTYWSLANFHLDTTDFEKTHSNVSGGGAYAGLQILSDGSRVGIISFWKITYKENNVTKELRFNRIYPKGEEMNFSGEGEGTTYRGTYKWESSVWYSFVLHTWDDQETGKTLIGVWIQNLKTQEWTLFSYFNTNLSNSYIGGGYGALAFFQEIFDNKYENQERFFQLKNMYVFDRIKKDWVSINTSELRYSENLKGTREVGHTLYYFYGYSGPTMKEKHENIYEVKGSITQPSKPHGGYPGFESYKCTITTTKATVTWKMNPKNCPCYKYFIEIKQKLSNDNSKTIHSKYITRPEVTTYTYSSTFKGTYTINMRGYSICNEPVIKGGESITV